MIGYSTGAVYKLVENTVSIEAIEILKKYNIDGIEILVRKFEDFDRFKDISDDILNGFQYISLHIPGKEMYTKDSRTNIALENIRDIVNRFGFTNVVLHPEVVQDWSVFENFLDIPFSIENMDDRKNFGKDPQDLENIFSEFNFGFTLDIQHIFVNDMSLSLCNEFLSKYMDRLKEIHISAYDRDILHTTLFKKKQDMIISKVKEIIEERDVPIIIESVLDSQDEIPLEIKYIQENLK